MGVTNFPNGINVGSEAGGTAVLQLGTTEVGVTAAELNKLSGAIGGKVLGYDSNTPQVVASGSTAITGAGTVATGLAGAAVAVIVASIANNGTAAGEAFVVNARPTGSAGSVIFNCFDRGGTVATTAGTVNWIAVSTAA